MQNFSRKLGVLVQRDIESIEKAKEDLGENYLLSPEYEPFLPAEENLAESEDNQEQ